MARDSGARDGSAGGKPAGGERASRRPDGPPGNASAAAAGRAAVAEAAAVMIVEEAEADWQFARRKAARQLGLDERVAMPDRVELEAAVRRYVEEYLGEEQAGAQAEAEEEALEWMDALAGFQPELTGAVAEGWAYPGCEIRLELLAHDAKIVEIALLNRGIDVRHAPTRGAPQGPASLDADGETGPVRLVVQDLAQRRNRKRDRLRIAADELRRRHRP